MKLKRMLSFITAGLMTVSAMAVLSVSTSAAIDTDGRYWPHAYSFSSRFVSVPTNQNSYYSGITNCCVWLEYNGNFYSCSSGMYKGKNNKGSGYARLDGYTGGTIGGSRVKHSAYFTAGGNTGYSHTYIAPVSTQTSTRNGNYATCKVGGVIYW